MKVIYPPFVLKRMIERSITVADVRDVLENGELLEEYKADSPPRYLLPGWSRSRLIHGIREDDPVAGLVECGYWEPWPTKIVGVVSHVRL